VVGVATLSMILLATICRSLVLECFDPIFARAVGAGGGWAYGIFMGLVVLNLVAAFQALGTLMAVGLMMLPALAARFWSEDIGTIIGTATVFAVVSSISGLLVSFHVEIASGPAIVLSAAVIYVTSILLGARSGLVGRLLRRPHYHDPKEVRR
jgi:zinc/manganese transport system permease protein